VRWGGKNTHRRFTLTRAKSANNNVNTFHACHAHIITIPQKIQQRIESQEGENTALQRAKRSTLTVRSRSGNPTRPGELTGRFFLK